jgi:imidazole glycerol phosphate synthase subunit HisF
MKIILCLLALAVAHAQEAPVVSTYSAYKSTALTSAAETITVQQPAVGSARRLSMKAASVYCSVSCTVTLKRSGTAATSTTLATTPASPDYAASTATAWSASNVGSGTTLLTWVLAAGTAQGFDLTGIEFLAGGTSQNFSVGTSSITGTATIKIDWTETGAVR